MTDDEAHVDALRVMVEDLRTRNEKLTAALYAVSVGYNQMGSDDPIIIDQGRAIIVRALAVLDD